MEDLPANPAVDQVLDALERRGKTLREFTAIVGLTDGDPFVGDLSTRTGRMIFQKIGQDEGRLRVIFDQRLNGKVAQREDSEYMLDNGWLTERNYKRKTQTRREIVKPGEKLNLLSLGQGPFPLPIGQKKQDVLDMFKVSIQPLTGEESKDKDLSKTVHVTLETKPNTRFSRRFGAIDVWVDRKTHFPVQIHTQAPDESDPHLTRLQNLQINPTAGLKDSDFQLPNIDEQEWSMHTEPYRE